MATEADANLVTLHAFELRADADVESASCSYGDEGRTFQIVEALDATGDSDHDGVVASPAGVVVVDAQVNQSLAEALQQMPFLKNASVPDDSKEAAIEAAVAVAAANPQDQPEPVGIDSIRAQQEYVKAERAKQDRAASRKKSGAGGPSGTNPDAAASGARS